MLISTVAAVWTISHEGQLPRRDLREEKMECSLTFDYDQGRILLKDYY